MTSTFRQLFSTSKPGKSNINPPENPLIHVDLGKDKNQHSFLSKSRAGASHVTFQVDSPSRHREQTYSSRRPRSRTRSTHDSRPRRRSSSHERSHRRSHSHDKSHRRSYSHSYGREHTRSHKEHRTPGRSDAYYYPSISHQEPWYAANKTPQYLHPHSVPSPLASGYASPYGMDPYLVSTPSQLVYSHPSYYVQQQPTPYVVNGTPHHVPSPGVMQHAATAGSTSSEYAARNASMAPAYYDDGSRSHARYYGITEDQIAYHNSIDDPYASSYPRMHHTPRGLHFGGQSQYY